MSGYYLKMKEPNPFNISNKLKLLQFRYKMYLNIVGEKKEREDTGTHKQAENTGTSMGLVHYHVTFACLG